MSERDPSASGRTYENVGRYNSAGHDDVSGVKSKQTILQTLVDQYYPRN